MWSLSLKGLPKYVGSPILLSFFFFYSVHHSKLNFIHLYQHLCNVSLSVQYVKPNYSVLNIQEDIQNSYKPKAKNVSMNVNTNKNQSGDFEEQGSKDGQYWRAALHPVMGTRCGYGEREEGGEVVRAVQQPPLPAGPSFSREHRRGCQSLQTRESR